MSKIFQSNTDFFNRIYIAVSYFFYLSIANIQQMYYFTRIACILWKNSKHLEDYKLESSQRLKRNKKAVKTIFFMVIVCDFLVMPSAILKSVAVYHNGLSAFRGLSNILLLMHCSFNSVFYIWRDQKLKKTATHFLQDYFAEVKIDDSFASYESCSTKNWIEPL